MIGALPEMFFEVRRVASAADAVAEQNTDGRFHVLNVVEGDRAPSAHRGRAPSTPSTMLRPRVPASVGPYRVHNPAARSGTSGQGNVI